MKNQAKKKPFKRIALALSLCALIIWGILGTGTSLAWFTDTSPEIKNIFNFAEFDLEVSHYDKNKNWTKVDATTKIFDKEALYEPGYVQVVYLEITNKGTVPFEFSTAVIVNDCPKRINVFGQTFLLQDHLKFGVITDMTKKDIESNKLEREIAKTNSTIDLKDIANTPLHRYDTNTDTLNPNESKYIAIIVRMPEEVGNIANHRDDDIPFVDLGITVKADQLTK